MRVPLSWLREFAPLPEEATAEQLLETMIMRGGARGRRSQGDFPLPAGHVA